jgi:DNA N-6-adenine-methyltransferase (Dam)
MDFHEIADLFPLLGQAELNELADDIAAHGLLHPITIYEEKILEGRNRYLACQQAGVEPRFEPFTGDDPIQFVISCNLRRRQLTSGQRAAVALGMEEYYAKQAKMRQLANLKHQGDKALVVEIIPQRDEPGRAAEQAAKDMGTNTHYVTDVKRIKAAAPEKFKLVWTGELSIPDALRELEVPHVAHNAGNNEWYTPRGYIERAVAVMGAIDLDPASTKLANKVVGAAHFYTADDDGLTKRWKGRVFMNPPYATELIGRFVDKLLTSKGVTEAIVLVNNATETQWFQLLAQKAGAVCFPSGRVKFWNPDKKSAPLQGQAVLYIGPHASRFVKHFSDLGTTWHS